MLAETGLFQTVFEGLLFKELVAPAADKLAALGECMHQHIFLSSQYSHPLLLCFC
jgi:hypothetical protein